MTTWSNKFDFKNSVMDWAAKLEIKVVAIYLRPMKNKWASCSTGGHLNFNDQLLEIDRRLGEYVIVHELLHFRVANHGPLWKSYMQAYLSDWEALDRRLKAISKKVND
ncbi:M48 family metallopeptidase [candidate division KSB1 bacterium]|nr:M48 family metallopeptidase [candidate division KSB1 bacterium]